MENRGEKREKALTRNLYSLSSIDGPPSSIIPIPLPFGPFPPRCYHDPATASLGVQNTNPRIA